MHDNVKKRGFGIPEKNEVSSTVTIHDNIRKRSRGSGIPKENGLLALARYVITCPLSVLGTIVF